MKKGKNIKSYTEAELKARRADSRTDLARVDALTDEELERRIAEDKDELDMNPDWTQARLVLPGPKKSVHLRLEQEIIDFFKSQGKGHIARMQSVLKTYADTHRQRGKQK